MTQSTPTTETTPAPMPPLTGDTSLALVQKEEQNALQQIIEQRASTTSRFRRASPRGSPERDRLKPLRDAKKKALEDAAKAAAQTTIPGAEK